jgi:hypothetical protein
MATDERGAKPWRGPLNQARRVFELAPVPGAGYAGAGSMHTRKVTVLTVVLVADRDPYRSGHRPWRAAGYADTD